MGCLARRGKQEPERVVKRRWMGRTREEPQSRFSLDWKRRSHVFSGQHLGRGPHRGEQPLSALGSGPLLPMVS